MKDSKKFTRLQVCIEWPCNPHSSLNSGNDGATCMSWWLLQHQVVTCVCECTIKEQVNQTQNCHANSNTIFFRWNPIVDSTARHQVLSTCDWWMIDNSCDNWPIEYLCFEILSTNVENKILRVARYFPTMWRNHKDKIKWIKKSFGNQMDSSPGHVELA